MSYEVRRGIIREDTVRRALRHLHWEVRAGWLSADNIKAWEDDHHWFPHAGLDVELTCVADELPPEWQTGEREPGVQIILQLPTVGERAFEAGFHADDDDGAHWERIVGVPLSTWSYENGGVRFPDPDGYCPTLQPGDAIMLSGDQQHGPGPNVTGHIRWGLYFRWRA